MLNLIRPGAVKCGHPRAFASSSQLLNLVGEAPEVAEPTGKRMQRMEHYRGSLHTSGLALNEFRPHGHTHVFTFCL